ncbi:MAG: peroxidase [Micavibrio sp.]|nr:peroxidase [Micavibrio sp.]|tara:strand:- start:5245 stop:5793 length:549 start_codon:yes stop_codon:yes gene_type:complete
MTRISPTSNPQQAAQDSLDKIRQKLGKTPNIFTTLAHSPAALGGYMAFSGALGDTKLDGKLKEQIALACAGYNGCDYCASAHTLMGGKAGLNDDELSSALKGKATDDKTQAALTFTTALLEKRGKISDEDMKAVQKAGFGDQEVVEMIAVISLNIFTNYFNEAVKTDVDFPKVSSGSSAKAA